MTEADMTGINDRCVALSLTGGVAPRVAAISIIWGAFEPPIAALAGACFYHEHRDPTAAR